MRKLLYTIDKDDNGRKLKEYLKNSHGYSREIIRKLKTDIDGVKKNGKQAIFIDILYEGDIVEVFLKDKGRLEPNHNTFVEILYDDQDIIIYDKPDNMPIHPSRSHQGDTLGNIYGAYCEGKKIEGIFRPIFRLDADTTGICVIGKHQLSASLLNRNIFKKYKGIVCGKFIQKEGKIEKKIGRERVDSIKRIVDKDGDIAITNYRVIEEFGEYSLVDIWLETGRTHQIRVHFADMGYPLLGDKMYGGDLKYIDRHSLHCYSAEFIHPIYKRKIDIISNLPTDMSQAIIDIKNENNVF